MFVDPVKRMLAPKLSRKKSRDLHATARKTAAMRQHEYVVARRSILGALSSLPITARNDNKVLHLKKMMAERGAVFPALSPQEVRAKRERQKTLPSPEH